jgi:hypothetical protein
MRKSEQICARVTPEVMASLRSMANKHSMLLSEFIRRTLAEKVSGLAPGVQGNEPGHGPREPEGPFQRPWEAY